MGANNGGVACAWLMCYGGLDGGWIASLGRADSCRLKQCAG
jgi:hypothetical protein